MRICTFAMLVSAFASVLSAQDSEKPPAGGVRKFALFAPKPSFPLEAREKHLKGAGVCVVYLRSDGTVSRAVMRPSTGEPLLDKAAIDAFSRWKFVPGSTFKVKIPIRYSYAKQKT